MVAVVTSSVTEDIYIHIYICVFNGLHFYSRPSEETTLWFMYHGTMLLPIARGVGVGCRLRRNGRLLLVAAATIGKLGVRKGLACALFESHADNSIAYLCLRNDSAHCIHLWCVCMCVCVFVCLFDERDKEHNEGIQKHRASTASVMFACLLVGLFVCVGVCVCVCVCVCVYMYVYILRDTARHYCDHPIIITQLKLHTCICIYIYIYYKDKQTSKNTHDHTPQTWYLYLLVIFESMPSGRRQYAPFTGSHHGAACT